MKKSRILVPLLAMGLALGQPLRAEDTTTQTPVAPEQCVPPVVESCGCASSDGATIALGTAAVALVVAAVAVAVAIHHDHGKGSGGGHHHYHSHNHG